MLYKCYLYIYVMCIYICCIDEMLYVYIYVLCIYI